MTPLLAIALACKPAADPVPSPGRVVLHRLNRAEYDNTVRDLFGTSLRPARDFPSDDFALGFDNVAGVLSISPLHLELYDRAADAIVDDLFGVGDVPPETWSFEPEQGTMTADNGNTWDSTAWILWAEGALTATIWAPADGDYTLSADVLGIQAGEEPVGMSFLVDGVAVADVEVTAEDEPVRNELRVSLTAGRHTIGVAYTNELQAPPEVDRNLVVDRVALTGPLDVPREPSPAHDVVIPCDPADGEDACAEQVVRTLSRRAWRRVVSEAEVGALLELYALTRVAGGSWDEGMRSAFKGILLSPWFVYRVELDPAVAAGSPGARPLSGFELATRLSYFLWSSTPDDRLLDLAQAGTLGDPDVLEAEARRMLDDPRAEALVDNLGGQWLGVRKVDEAAPSPELFPDWDEALRASMRDEIRAFVGDILLGDRPATELLTSDRSFADERLAAFYAGGERPGLLGRAGLLAALSYPNRTSPVIRGNWVLSNLLCSPPPPPPPGIPALDEASAEPISLREQLELHRSNPACSSCHDQMDAVGLALEEFDAIGRQRTVDELGLPIDASGELKDLGAFVGGAEMQQLLATDPRVPECMVEKTFTYALGRGPEDDDDAELAAILNGFAGSGFRFRELAVAVALSRPFRFRDGEAP